MSSKIVAIPDEDVENHPPSAPLSCTNNSNGLSISNSSTVKRNSYIKQRGRRRRWWYFNRGLQPISEVAESKDDVLKCENNDELPVFGDDSTVFENHSPEANNAVISTNLLQNKEGYSACLKVIEKFQEVVMDSAVRVIQAAFKRFRERRRFLRIKKAVMVIQRNLRKWLESKHPCIGSANFERQSSDGSNEYRESVENDFDCCITEEKDKMQNSLTSADSEQFQDESDFVEVGNSIENNIQVIPKLEKTLNENDKTQCVLHMEKSTLVSGNRNTEPKQNENSEDMEPKAINCLPGSEEEIMVESRSTQEENFVTFSNETEQQEIYTDVKSLLEELLVKVSSSFPSSDSCEDQDNSEKSNNCKSKEQYIETTDIHDPCSFVGNSVDNIEAQKDLCNKAKMDLQQGNLNYVNEEHCKTADGSGENGIEKNVQNVAKTSPDSLRAICHRFLDITALLNSSNMEEVGS